MRVGYDVLLLGVVVLFSVLCMWPASGALESSLTSKTHLSTEEVVCGFDAILQDYPIDTFHVQPESLFGAQYRSRTMNVSAASDDDGWEYMRIGVFTEDMKDPERYCTEAGQLRPNFYDQLLTCKEKEVMTQEDVDYFRNTIVPFSAQMYSERLKVIPLTERIIVGPYSGGYCHEFTIPESHSTEGVEYDYVLYAAAAPVFEGIGGWAGFCKYSNNRAYIGMSVLPAGRMEITDDPLRNSDMRTFSHELGHLLGFSSAFFEPLGMQTTMTGIRGKPYPVSVLTSPAVLREARKFFNWDGVEYVELMDKGWEDPGGSHWKRRIIFDDSMANSGAFSVFLLAALEDLGYYKPDFSKAEPSYFNTGYQEGEKWFTSPCIINGTPLYRPYCTRTTKKVCSYTRTGYGRCNPPVQDEEVPEYFQYYDNPKLTGESQTTDYCPFVETEGNAKCATAQPGYVVGSIQSPTSKCVDGNDDIVYKDEPEDIICVEVKCNTKSKSFQIKVLGQNEYADCPSGSVFSIPEHSSDFKSGSITCPEFYSICVPGEDENDDGTGSDGGGASNNPGGSEDGGSGNDNSSSGGDGNSNGSGNSGGNGGSGGKVTCRCRAKGVL